MLHHKVEFEVGWALKQQREVKRFSLEMREWVKAHFMNGERTGKKVTGDELNKLQRAEFAVSEWKTAVQFKSMLSRMTHDYRNAGLVDTNAIEEKYTVDVDGGNELYEDAIQEAMELDGRIADIKINDYVAVYYGAYWQWLPGVVVEQIDESSCVIKSMKRSSTENSFTWPDLNEPGNSRDFRPLEIPTSDILAILDAPALKSRYWSFSNEDVNKVRINLIERYKPYNR